MGRAALFPLDSVPLPARGEPSVLLVWLVYVRRRYCSDSPALNTTPLRVFVCNTSLCPQGMALALADCVSSQAHAHGVAGAAASARYSWQL